MRQLPAELVRHVLEYAFLPACKHPPLLVCRAWVLRNCRRERPLACPAAPPLCAAHQQPELALWAELWQTANTQHTNYFPLRNPPQAALQCIQTHMAAHLPFDVIAVVTAPPPQEAWIWIAPGHRASLWWEANRAWRGLPEDDD
jgi:hypothetical protein